MTPTRATVQVMLLCAEAEVALGAFEVERPRLLASAAALARLVLAARRFGGVVALDVGAVGPAGVADVRAALDLVGLGTTPRPGLRPGPPGCLVVQVVREPEEREQGRVDEVVVADDPSA